MSNRKKRRKRKEEHSDNERWLITYSDLITLLLVFFIVLYSMSSIQNEKFNQLVDSLKTAFQGDAVFTESTIKPVGQHSDITSTPIAEVTQKPTQTDANKKQLDQLYAKLQQYIKKNKLQNVLSLENMQRGVQLSFKEKILFDLGKADVKKQAEPILGKVGGILKTVPNDISVEGYTDNNPIVNDAEFKSNWELSGGRAINVMYYLINKDHLSPNRLHYAGYGEYKPIAKNDTKQHQSLNRRVNIIILRNDVQN